MHRLDIYGYKVRYGHSPEKQKKYNIIEGVCFSNAFERDCKSKYYELYILKGDADLKQYNSNYCFWNKQEIKNHLRQIPKFCKFRYTVNDCVYKKASAYRLNFYIDSDNRLVHKYILTWIRSLFEWPFNLCLLHARELHKLPEFKFESIVNLYNVVTTVYRLDIRDHIHNFGANSLSIKKSEIIKSVGKENRVNKVFPLYNGNKEIPTRPLVENFEDITPELFENNKAAYIETYHILKNYENGDNR